MAGGSARGTPAERCPCSGRIIAGLRRVVSHKSTAALLLFPGRDRTPLLARLLRQRSEHAGIERVLRAALPLLLGQDLVPLLRELDDLRPQLLALLPLLLQVGLPLLRRHLPELLGQLVVLELLDLHPLVADRVDQVVLAVAQGGR